MAEPNKPDAARSQRGPQPPQSAGQPQSMATTAPASAPPVSEVEQLKARLAALEAKLSQLTAAPATAPVVAHVAPAPQMILPASEIIRQREAASRKEDDEKLRASKDKAERELASGPHRFEVSLVSNPKRVVGARDEGEARDKYRRYYGIKSTQHEIIVRDLSAAA